MAQELESAPQLSIGAIPFDNSYVRLPERFWQRVAPTPVSAPRLIKVNQALASHLGIDPAWVASEEAVQILAGNRVPENTESIATAYAGHQFGGFVPQLGDGRAALGPVLREYVVSEAMAALGIPTTRALAAVVTGDQVMREDALPGAVFTRVASSHIRVGTFQFFASRRDDDGVRILADHVIARHYPHVAQAEQPYRALLEAVINAQAQLIAQWLMVGFIHGVMNTDNMSVAGETIDYGPCAFMDEYDPRTVFSSIDRFGRYAYANQPNIALWNLTRLAECLVPLLDADEDRGIAIAEEALAGYPAAFERAYQAGMRRKLGLTSEQEGDAILAQDLLKLMHSSSADFTNTFRRLCDAAAGDDGGLRSFFPDAAALDEWLGRWRARVAQDGSDNATRAAAMRAVNPAFIPRNHRVEAMIRAAVDRDDFAPFEELLAVLSKPYGEQPEFADYAVPPEENQRVRETFCGT